MSSQYRGEANDALKQRQQLALEHLLELYEELDQDSALNLKADASLIKLEKLMGFIREHRDQKVRQYLFDHLTIIKALASTRDSTCIRDSHHT
jgi:hypothetical protein